MHQLKLEASHSIFSVMSCFRDNQNNNYPLYFTSTGGLSEIAILIELSSPFSLLCLAPIERFL